MTRLMQFANNATSRLAATLSAVGTTVTVIPGDGSKFPSLTAGQYFMATLIKADGSKEVVKVTARTSDTMTIVRAAEAVGGVQTAYSFNAADRIDLRLTAGELASELDRLDRHALTGVLNKSANYTAVEADASNLIRVDSTAAACTITLPQISTLTEDFIIAVSKVSGDNNAVYIAGSGGNTINGATPYALVSQWQGAWLVADRSTNTWTAVSSGVGSSFIFVDKFTGTGAQTAFTLTAGVYSSNQVDVTISGVTQNPGIDYTATGTTLTFTSAPPNATVILARYTQSAPQVTTGTCTIERQVATLGQTGFALANGYIPGSNTMQVFVNGLLLSLGIDYAETGANSVAFTAGLSAGDEVQFVMYGKTVSAADSGNVSYTPAGTGAVATTVQSKLRESVSVSVKDFGAAADGTTDDTAAVNAAILAAQTSKSNQLSYDEIYTVEVLFEAGKDYKIVGPILLPSGIQLNGRGCRLIGAYPSAASTAYSDAATSIIETAYFDGTTIATNRSATLNTKRIVGSAIRNFAFVNANCGINTVQWNERSIIENVTFSNCSAVMRFKNGYYGSVDGVRIANCSQATNQYATLLYGGNANAMSLKRISVADASVGLSISGPASSGSEISSCTFEGAYAGTGIYFADDAYCSGWSITSNYFEGVQTAIKLVAGAGTYGIKIDANYFDSCQWALIAAASTLRLATFLNNSQPDGGGIIRNLVDVSASDNDIRLHSASKTGSTSGGPSAFLTNTFPSNQSTGLGSSTWLNGTNPTAKASLGLLNLNSLNEFAFEGAHIVSVGNQVPFCTVTNVGDTQINVLTGITYDTSNLIMCHLVINVSGSGSGTFDCLIMGSAVYPLNGFTGSRIAVVNSGGVVQLQISGFSGVSTAYNITGVVRHA